MVGTKYSREEVYAAIDGERAYQDARWNEFTTSTQGVHTVTEFILFMEHYLTAARQLVSTQGEPKASRDGLDFIRKVTALGVACMEQNGIVNRVNVITLPDRTGERPWQGPHDYPGRDDDGVDGH